MLHLFMKLIATDLTQSPNLVSDSATANIPSPLILTKTAGKRPADGWFLFPKIPLCKNVLYTTML